LPRSTPDKAAKISLSRVYQFGDQAAFSGSHSQMRNAAVNHGQTEFWLCADIVEKVGPWWHRPTLDSEMYQGRFIVAAQAVYLNQCFVLSAENQFQQYLPKADLMTWI
jgi:hypothetical protein